MQRYPIHSDTKKEIGKYLLDVITDIVSEYAEVTIDQRAFEIIHRFFDFKSVDALDSKLIDYSFSQRRLQLVQNLPFNLLSNDDRKRIEDVRYLQTQKYNDGYPIEIKHPNNFRRMCREYAIIPCIRRIKFRERIPGFNDYEKIGWNDYDITGCSLLFGIRNCLQIDGRNEHPQLNTKFANMKIEICGYDNVSANLVIAIKYRINTSIEGNSNQF